MIRKFFKKLSLFVFILGIFFITPMIVKAGDVCTETDGGVNYFVKGEIVIDYENGLSRIENDSCVDSNTLREWYCGDADDPAGVLRSENYVNCAHGCIDGRCGDLNLEITQAEYYAPNVEIPNLDDYVGYKIQVKNTGSLKINGPFTISAYLNGKYFRYESYDSSFSLNPGDSFIDQQYSYTKFTELGDNEIKVVVDVNNEVEESDEDDNEIIIEVFLEDPEAVIEADLIPTELKARIGLYGTDYSLDDTNINFHIGDELNITGVYDNLGGSYTVVDSANPFSSNLKVAKNETTFFDKTQGSDQGAVAGFWAWTPEETGVYTITLTVDIDDEISESDENNNVFTDTITIIEDVEGLPDLIINGLSFGKDVDSGRENCLLIEVKNIGEGLAKTETGKGLVISVIGDEVGDLFGVGQAINLEHNQSVATAKCLDDDTLQKMGETETISLELNVWSEQDPIIKESNYDNNTFTKTIVIDGDDDGIIYYGTDLFIDKTQYQFMDNIKASMKLFGTPDSSKVYSVNLYAIYRDDYSSVDESMPIISNYMVGRDDVVSIDISETEYFKTKGNGKYGFIICSSEACRTGDSSDNYVFYTNAPGLDVEIIGVPEPEDDDEEDEVINKSEQVKCIFNNFTENNKCYLAGENDQYNCFGEESCIMNITEEDGKKLTWKSSCGGYAYTTVDGVNEYAKFDCSQDAETVEIIENTNRLYDDKFDEILVELKQLRDTVREQNSKIKYLEKLTHGVKKLAAKMEEAINNFITYGVDDNTQRLGEGERAAVMYSYKNAFNKLPETEEELADAIKIANGRWPGITNQDAEKRAKEQFQKIYKRIADMNDASDNAAVTVMAYGLRQKAENRNLNSEKTGINTFRNIYGYNPDSTEDWNIMQAITYSGATRGVDTDGDFLTDERELELGTDPNNPDSDGDGYLDGIEVANGYDPLK